MAGVPEVGREWSAAKSGWIVVAVPGAGCHPLRGLQTYGVLFHGFRDAQSGVAPPEATRFRPLRGLREWIRRVQRCRRSCRPES